MSDWRDEANCRRVPPDVMFPEGKGQAVQIRHAKMICSSCVVKAECLGFAQSLARAESVTGFILHGVWGGLSSSEVRESLGRGWRDTRKPGSVTP